MWVALIVGVLFFAGALFNIFGPEPNPTEASAGLLISAVLIGVFRFWHAGRLEDEALLAWLLENATDIHEGGARYGELQIKPETVLTRYQAALSFLIVSFKVPSKLYIEGQPPPFYLPVLLSSVTFFLGWWGFPWGPVYTVQVLASNMRGGVEETVADVFALLADPT